MRRPRRLGVRFLGAAGLLLLILMAGTPMPTRNAASPSVQRGDESSVAAPAPFAITRAPGCQRWVAPSPEGDDANPGTASRPWATLQHAAQRVPDNKCTVWFKNGIYSAGSDIERRFTTMTTFRAVNTYQAVLQHRTTVLDIGGARKMTFRGFEFRHSGPRSSGIVVYVSGSKDAKAKRITFRNNIFHDSYDDDLLKILFRAHLIVVRNNVFYNQGDGEQHIDVNSVTDVRITDNLFFNDFARSGRTNPNSTKHYIVVKDSNGNQDGLTGSERIKIRRNVFMNWEGGVEPIVAVGNDGKPYHEAENVRIENNLMIGNTRNKVSAAFSVKGARDITFVNNTVVGDLPSSSYAFDIDIKGSNPRNRNILFSNNIWSDPTGTMGSDLSGGSNDFSNGDPRNTVNLTLDRNLYWNGGRRIPRGELVSPLIDDARRVVRDPRLNTDQSGLVVPFWTGSAFLSGNSSIRAEFLRLVRAYGRIPAGSPAVGKALRTRAPADDILGRRRDRDPDLGAYEARRQRSSRISGWRA